MKTLALLIALPLLCANIAAAQTQVSQAPLPPVSQAPVPQISRDALPRNRNQAEVARINAWTVGLAAGQLEGAPIRFATDIERVVDDGNNLNVLPIVTRGPTANVDDLLYLKGVDMAIINADTLAQFEQQIPDIRQRIDYVLSLYPSELHVFVRPGINSLDDLKGRKVNFNTQGTAAAYTGPMIFKLLHLKVQQMFIPHQVALAQMRSGQGDIAAVVFVTAKPIAAFTRSWPSGFKFLSVPYRADMPYYLPATLTAKDYPQLIAKGQEIQTLAVPTILAAYNWPKASDRYRRVARLVDRLFDRINVLQGPGFHPKWKDVVLNATVPALNRFPAAQEWLDNAKAVAGTKPQTVTMSRQEYRQFMQWRRMSAAGGR